MYKYNFKKKYKNNNSLLSIKGFTLVELIVVVSIFLIISGITIFNYNDFRTNISLSNLTDNIALAIRKAQSYAIGSRIIEGVSGNTYGIHFAVKEGIDELNSSNKSFLMYYQTENNTYYDNTGGSVCGTDNYCMEIFNISGRDIIESISYVVSGQEYNLSVDQSLDIYFKRPSPAARFCVNNEVDKCFPVSISKVDIIISNNLSGAEKKTKIISVQNTGQISIK